MHSNSTRSTADLGGRGIEACTVHADSSRNHKGFSCDGILPERRLLPGDDKGPDGCGDQGKVDHLVGPMEKVIIGKLIPAGRGMKRYRNVRIDTSRVDDEAFDLNPPQEDFYDQLSGRSACGEWPEAADRDASYDIPDAG